MTSKAARRRFRKAERLRAFRASQQVGSGKWVNSGSGRQLRTVVAVMVFLVFGVLLSAFGGLMFAGAVGLSGTSGRLHVESCGSVIESGKPVTRCFGELRSSSGRLVDPAAVVQADARVGATIAVRDEPLVGLETLGFRALEGWATVTALGFLVLDFAILLVLALRSKGPLRVSRGVNRSGMRFATAAASPRSMLWLAGSVAVGALVYGTAVLCELVIS
ncbi:hypothetical protein ABT009_46845 [Streptomyces sp. NPDC002896]|uniref:hypothetical protein n=1 Tax=Streptomyces sp. NPDC002896 TaxID=3154438 RepID=UPI00331DCDA8